MSKIKGLWNHPAVKPLQAEIKEIRKSIVKKVKPFFITDQQNLLVSRHGSQAEADKWASYLHDKGYHGYGTSSQYKRKEDL